MEHTITGYPERLDRLALEKPFPEDGLLFFELHSSSDSINGASNDNSLKKERTRENNSP